MSIRDHKIGAWTQSVSSLPVHPSAEGMTAQELQEAFDSNSDQIKEAFNGLIDELEPSIDGDKSVFIAKYASTTAAEIEAAYQAGNTILLKADYNMSTPYESAAYQRISATKHRFFVFAIGSSENQDCLYARYFTVENGSWTLTNLGTVAPLSSPVFLDEPKAPTPPEGDNSTRIATTEFVGKEIVSKINVFVAVYDTTTSAEIEAAYQAGKAVLCLYGNYNEVGVLYARVNASRHMFVTASYYTNYGYNQGLMRNIMCNNNSWSVSNSIALASRQEMNDRLAEKQDVLTIDSVPTQNSTNPVESGGVYDALQNAGGGIFPCIPSTTTYAEITAAIAAGKLPVVIRDLPRYSKTYVHARTDKDNNIHYFVRAEMTDTEAVIMDYWACSSSNQWISDGMAVNRNDIYVCTYNVTGISDIYTALTLNKLVICKYGTGNLGNLFCMGGTAEDIIFEGIVTKNNKPYYVCVEIFDNAGWQLVSEIDLTGGSGRDVWYGVCETSANQRIKVATAIGTGTFALSTGVMVNIRFTHNNTYSDIDNPMQLQVGNTEPKEIIITSSGAVVPALTWTANEIVQFVYDGTYWRMVAKNRATIGGYGITRLSNSTNSNSESEAATPKAVKDALDAAKTYADSYWTLTYLDTTESVQSVLNRIATDGIFPDVCFMNNIWFKGGSVIKDAASDVLYGVVCGQIFSDAGDNVYLQLTYKNNTLIPTADNDYTPVYDSTQDQWQLEMYEVPLTPLNGN